MNTLNTPVRIGPLVIRNRLYRAPVLEGAGASKDPAAEYAKHFVPNARAGVGLIVQGNTIVLPEGRTSPGMSAIDGPERMLDLRRVTDPVHAQGAAIIVQLGHGGLFALEGWHREFVRKRTRPPIAVSPPPWWLRATHGGAHTLDTDEVADLARRFGTVAAWAKDAGYDGVQLASSNAKLLHQFLSRTFNRRRDRYGGDLAGRTLILREIREAIARAAGPEFPVLLKFCAFEDNAVGCGIRLDEGVEIARIAEDAGFDAVTPVATSALPDATLCKGDYPAFSFENASTRKRLLEAAGSPSKLRAIEWSMWLSAKRRPFEAVWNRSSFAAVKKEVGIPVFAVGGIRSPAEANAILAAGEADLVGVGRPFYAEPDLARWFLAAEERTAKCESCNRCLVPQMLGMPGVCYNPAVKAGRRAA